MIKKLLLPLLFFIACFSTAQSFTATYNFAAVTGTCPGNCTIDPTPAPVVAGWVFGSFWAFGTGSTPNASGRFSFQGWPIGATNGVDTYTAYTGSLSPASYYQVTLAPDSGYTASLSGISFSVRRSGTGIRNYAVRSSLDGYTGNLPAGTGGNPKLSVVGNNVFFWTADATSTSADQMGSTITLDTTFNHLLVPVTFRFYGWNSENGSQGTFSIDSVVFTGLAYDTPPVITGLKQNLYEENRLQLIPNPSERWVTLKSSRAFLNVKIINGLGQIVFWHQPEMPPTIPGVRLIGLSAGTYLLQADLSEGRSSYQRLLICK